MYPGFVPSRPRFDSALYGLPARLSLADVLSSPPADQPAMWAALSIYRRVESAHGGYCLVDDGEMRLSWRLMVPHG